MLEAPEPEGPHAHKFSKSSDLHSSPSTFSASFPEPCHLVGPNPSDLAVSGGSGGGG